MMAQNGADVTMCRQGMATTWRGNAVLIQCLFKTHTLKINVTYLCPTQSAHPSPCLSWRSSGAPGCTAALRGRSWGAAREGHVLAGTTEFPKSHLNLQICRIRKATHPRRWCCRATHRLPWPALSQNLHLQQFCHNLVIKGKYWKQWFPKKTAYILNDFLVNFHRSLKIISIV